MEFSALTQKCHENYLPGVDKQIEIPSITLPQMFATAVSSYGPQVALDFLGREYTFEEISKQVSKAAGLLYSVGVRRGDIVALALPNCPQHLVLFYAITSLGAIVAEHNPLAPPAQLRAQVQAHGARIIIAWEKTVAALMPTGQLQDRLIMAVDITKSLPKRSQFLLRLPLKQAREQKNKMRARVPDGVQLFDRLTAVARSLPAHELPVLDPDDTAVLLHTGGTTGVPKAVELTHRNLLSNVEQNRLWITPALGQRFTSASVLPFFHAFGLTLSLVLSVQLGALQVMLPKFDTDMMLAAQRRHPLDFFVGVPPMFDRLEKRATERKIPLDSIKLSISGAMPLKPDIAARWEELTHSILIEGYGMTEASPVICGNPPSSKRRPSTLGLPLPGTDIKIVNPDNPEQEVQDGEIGELVARGPQVFKGYFNHADETAAVMLPGGWLRTGDLAYLEDGFLKLADRRKELIINGGFNIYPTEVENAVRTMPGVRDVAVVGINDGAAGESVVAALVLEPGAQIDLAQVRKWTADRLPRYAMPKKIAVVEDLPRSQIGKVMRRVVRENLESLQAATEKTAEQLRQKTAPVAETVENMADSLRTMISREKTGEHDKNAHLKDKATRGAGSADQDSESSPTTKSEEA